MPGLEIFQEAGRQLTICNACRYCEGYCPVFRAIETAGISNRTMCFTFPIFAMTAARVITRACIRRRTNLPSTSRRFWPKRASRHTGAGVGRDF